jgi:tetratricopeptide (TPR) repeat protein
MVLPAPLFHDILRKLGQDDGVLTRQFEPWFVSRQMLAGSTLNIVCLILAGLIPAALLFRKEARPAAIGVVSALMLIATLQSNRHYRDSVRYWQWMDETRPGRPEIQLNLAGAYIDRGEWRRARDLLMHLRYEMRLGGLLSAAANAKLGEAYAGLGDDKLAGAYFLRIGSAEEVPNEEMKHPLMAAGDFFFRLGYVSSAEHYWACATVQDPYDVRLYNSLGRALMYRNFFRAAASYFRFVLSRDGDDVTALYHLAFVADVLGDDGETEHCSERWKAVTGSEHDIDFQPILDGYKFEREKVREWFADIPLVMAAFGTPVDGNRYVLRYEGKDYSFWEMPLDVGKYLAERGKHSAAAEYLQLAFLANPDSKEAAQMLVDIHQRLKNLEEAERLEHLLETMPDEDKQG